MSSHCSRYPHCGCGSSYGTKCHLPSEMVPLDKNAYSDDPESLENIKEGIKKISAIEAAKVALSKKNSYLENGGKNKLPHHKYPSNYTKPKRRKK